MNQLVNFEFYDRFINIINKFYQKKTPEFFPKLKKLVFFPLYFLEIEPTFFGQVSESC